MAVQVDIESFDPGAAAQPGKRSFFLELGRPGSGEQFGLPVLWANGAKPGQTLVVIAGVHGDELEGVQAIHDVFRELDPSEMSGRVIAVPVVNVPAHKAVTRLSPVDSLNLARNFPGRKDGTLTERIAYYLTERIISQADFFLDLHSSGLAFLMPTMVGYDATDTKVGKASREAALLFGTPVVWGHHEVSPGRSLCAAIERGVPWLYVESPSGGRVSLDELPYYVNGLLNLLGHLKIIRRVTESRPPSLHLIGSGDLDRTLAVNTAGFFVPTVKLLDRVERGQVIGVVRDLFGETIEEIRTEQSGYVAILRATPLVQPGVSVCLVVDGSPLPVG